MVEKPIEKKGRNKGWDNLIPAKKGEVRNPWGRPKKEVCMMSSLKEELEKIYETEDGRKLTKQQALMKALVQKGLDGDVAAIKEIMDRIDGKVTQPVKGEYIVHNKGMIESIREYFRENPDDSQRMVNIIEAMGAKEYGNGSGVH